MKINENLIKAAKLLGVPYPALLRYPEDTQNSMTALIDVFDIENEDDAAEAYEELQALWLMAVIAKDMTEIAAATGIAVSTLNSLPIQTRKQMVYEFTLDNTDIANIYGILNAALSIRELPEISVLLRRSLAELESLEEETQKALCGVYCMEYGMTDDAELVSSLENILKTA